MSDASAVVVTYNGLPWVEQALTSVQGVETVLVDRPERAHSRLEEIEGIGVVDLDAACAQRRTGIGHAHHTFGHDTVTVDDEPYIGPLSDEALRFEADADHRGGGA